MIYFDLMATIPPIKHAHHPTSGILTKMPGSNEFTETFKFVHRIVRTMGLLPISVAKNGNAFVKSRFWTGYSVALFACLLVLYVNCVSFDYMTITMTDTARVMYVGGTVPIFITLTAAVFLGIKNRTGFLKMTNAFVDIEGRFRTVGIGSNYEIVRMYIWAETAFVAALLVYRILMGTFLIDFTFCLVTDAYWQDIYRIAVTQHFSTYVLEIYKKFQEINSFLDEFRRYIEESPSCPLYDHVIRRLNVAFDAYLQLFNVRKELNDIFGLQLFFYLLNNFYEMTILFYMGVENILGVNFFHSSLLMWIVTVVWPVWCLSVMIICIELCLRTKKEVNIELRMVLDEFCS